MTKCKLIPLNDNIVVRRLRAEAVSKGGIHIPDNAQKKTLRGVVLAVGPGRPCEALAMVNKDAFRLKPVVEIGQTVLLDEYGVRDVEVDGETLVVTGETNILAIIKEAT